MRSAGDYTAAGDSGVADVINAQRSKPCGGLPGPGTPLRSVDELNSAAALLPSGMNIAAAVAGSGYRGTHVRVIRLRNVVTDRKAARIIARNYCDSINSSAFEERGVYLQGYDAWIILGTPYPIPTADQSKALANRIVVLVNEARAESRRCGDREFSAAPPLQLADELQQAALIHSEDMSLLRLVTHLGRDGERVAERVTQLGYSWGAVGENIAAGQTQPESLVAEWLSSPGHCANIMNPVFVDMGVAFSTNLETKLGIYWTLVLAAPPPPIPVPVKKKRRWWSTRE